MLEFLKYIFAPWESKTRRQTPGFICKMILCKPIGDNYSWRGHCKRCGHKSR